MHDIRYYIDEQCMALRHILATRKACAADFVQMVLEDMPDRLYLVGSGTSCNAALCAAPFMETVLGVEVTACAPSQTPVIRGERPLIVFISQGGTSTNILRAIEQLRGYRSLALTGRENCRVNEVCGRHVLLDCGAEDAGPKTKGYTCTVLTLYLMAMEAALAAGKLSEAAYDEIAAALDACFAGLPQQVARAEACVEQHAGWLTAVPYYVIVGKGQAALVARECVIKLVETMMTPASAYEFEEYLHGPVSLIDGERGGIYLLPPEGDPDRARMLAVAKYHAEQSGRVLIIDCEDAGGAKTPWYAHVFTSVLPCQLMAAKLPAAMGVGKRGEEVFYAVDALVDIKFGHIV
ncbi:MAG: hypothetical protein IKB82_05495 [Clostridia bacterium]|nr:hypothetical protein [Clostridia bacterium]